MQRIRVLVLLGVCAVSGACISVKSPSYREIVVYLAPYQVDYGSILLAEPNITGYIHANKLDVSLLNPAIIGVTLVNASTHILRIPSYNKDAIGEIALSFELRDGSNTVVITRMPQGERKVYVSKHLKYGVQNIPTYICMEPGESIILVPCFRGEEWQNANEILAKKNSGKASLRAIYEYYESSENPTAVFYSKWIPLSKLIPYPLNSDDSEHKLVF